MSDHVQTPACPEKVVLRALLDGSLPAEQLAAVQAHADGCASCEAALKQMTVGGESWIGMAASLKERDEQTDGPLAAAMERLKTDDGSGDGDRDETDPQRTLDFLQPADDPGLLGKLGQHEITEVIGWGGMGVVLKAYDPSLHRVVAVKVLASHLAHHAVARKRFIREAQAAAAVCHDNVVTIHAIEDGVADASRIGLPTRDASATLPKIIMQFVAGGSLQERIDQDGPLELKEVLRIAMQTAAGLAAAHAQGVVHRDVKPANILLENGVQRVKLTDFGLARVMDDASLTLSGVIAGTPQYMAPEQAWGRDVDARADLFSLGAVMYAMCSGHSPFRARTTMAVLKRVCEDAPRPLRAINPDVPEWLVAIIEKLLAKNPDERFQTATEVSELLGKWLAHVQQPTVVRQPTQMEQISDTDGNAPIKSLLLGQTENHTNGRKSLNEIDLLAMSELEKRPDELRERMKLWGTGLAIAAVVLIPMFGGLMVVSTTEVWGSLEFLGSSVTRMAIALGLIAAFRIAWTSSNWLILSSGALFLAAVSSVRLFQLVGYLRIIERFPEHLPTALASGVQGVLGTGLLVGLLVGHPRLGNRSGSSSPATSPKRKLTKWPDNESSKMDLRSNLSAESGDRLAGQNQPGVTDPQAARAQLPARFVVWPLIVMWVLLGVMFAVVMADSGMRNIEGFLGFSAIQLVATFVLASVFRSAWNSSSSLVWIGSLLFLPFVASLFVWGASYRDAAALTQWLNALQALSAMAYWLGLLFVRPLFVQESDSRQATRSFSWGRALALSGLLLVPISMWVVMRMRMSEVSRQRAYYEATEAARITMPADTIVAPQARDPRRPQLDGRGFPKPELLSNNRTPESSFEVDPSEPIAGMPPSSIGGSAAMAAAPDSLRPLLGRWVVLTLQGDEPPFSSASAGGAPGGMGAMFGAPTAPPAANVTPANADQLHFLEFRDGKLFFDDSEHNRLSAEVRKDRELLLQTLNGESVRHGVFTIADDRLVICWTSRNQPLPRGFQPKPHEQLVVCRREWSRSSRPDDKGNVAVEKFNENSKLPKAEMPFSSREAAALQAAWAEKSKSPVEVTNSVGMKLRVIPPGSFGDLRVVATLAQSVGGAGSGFGGSGAGMMAGGDAAGGGMAMGSGPRSGERGYGAVSGPILVGVHEVTVAQFRQFVEDSKYVTEAERSENGQPAKPHSWRKPEIEQDSDHHPVVNVTFEDALAFCHWLSEKEKKPYRLLTRREWEFCARAGSWLPATLGPGKLAHRSQFFTTTAPVGSYTANSFGLHDFIGNVAEWAWHSDVPERTDARRSAPNTMIWSTDPTVFCGGDFRQHINRSQPHEWLHPTATTTPPVIGFRVACDLTAESAVSVPKHWPMSQLFMSQELVLVRKLADSGEKNSVEKGTEDKSTDDKPAGDKPAGDKPDTPTTQPDVRLVNAVWLEMLVHAEQMPYAVEWLDFEIERRATPSNETPNDFVHGKIEEAGAEAGWKPLDLALTLRLLEQTEFAPDPIATPLQNHVLTMPIPKPVTGQWASPDARRGLPSSFVRLEPAIQKPQLFRFLDLNAPHGIHNYRVRLKYRVPGIMSETVHSTGWFISMNPTEIDFDALDQRKLPENTPVIELKPKPSAAPVSK